MVHMQKFDTARIQQSKRRWMDFSPAFVWDADEASNPLHGSLRGDLSNAVVVSDGKRHGVATIDQLTTGVAL